jgi:transposase
MALVNAATLIAELGDLSRFTNPRQLMAYPGLVPSQHSSGASVKPGGLTKAGNSAARRLLIESLKDANSFFDHGSCGMNARDRSRPAQNRR